MEITKGENANLAGMEPRCPKCESKNVALYSSSVKKCYIECKNPECEFDLAPETVADFAQFFRSPAPTPPLDVEDEKRIAEIRERESKATKGPWGYDLNNTIAQIGSDGHEWEESIFQLPSGVRFPTAQDKHNSEFAAHSRQDIPFLLEQISLLRRHIASPAPQSQRERDLELAAECLEEMYDKWENGSPCFEEPETGDGYIGNAFELRDRENVITEVLNRLFPQAGRPVKAASPAQPEKE